MTGQDFGGANGSDLARARMHVMANLEAGTTCPCCDQFAREYRRTITSPMARWLIELVRRYQAEPRYYAVGDSWSLRIGSGPGDSAKLAYWGFIQQAEKDLTDTKRRTSGLWIPTQDGIEFAHGRITARRWAITYNAQVLRWEGPDWTVQQALGREFNYQSLMAGTL